MNLVAKKELIQLLDRGSEIDQIVFDTVDGEHFAFSNEEINIEGLREPFVQLIPKTTWTKKDYVIKFSELSLIGVETDGEGQGQLLLALEGETPTFITTTEAVFQLFESMSMGTYANFLLKNPSEHYELLKHNFDYWFGNKIADTSVLIRTVLENGQYIARCFASMKYQQIDNHILLYCTAWAIDKLKYNFRLKSQKITHSRMKLEFSSDEVFEIPNIGTLSYGFTVVNSESKAHAVEFLPTCNITNNDGTSVPIILDREIKIKHLGKDIKPVLGKILELEQLPQHVQRAIDTIRLIKEEKMNPLLAYKIQQSLIEVIGRKSFKKYQEKYTQVSSDNTYNLLEFFGRLNDVPVDDEDKQIALESMYWTVIQSLVK